MRCGKCERDLSVSVSVSVSGGDEDLHVGMRRAWLGLAYLYLQGGRIELDWIGLDSSSHTCLVLSCLVFSFLLSSFFLAV